MRDDFLKKIAIFAVKMRVNRERQYIAIDLKSFYASVECVERGLNPLDACLVVADKSRTEKTICLAVSPPLKAFGIPGRPRLFEVVQKLREVNHYRGNKAKSTSGAELARCPDVAVDYIVASPRMRLYVDYSTRIYRVYLRYIAPEHIHVYSIDEVFIDATPYLKTYNTSAHDLAMTMIREVLQETGITATAGIGTNMYLCKIAMDIMAKKRPPDSDGVRIAELDEMTYRRELWDHTPLTDFWRVGHGTAKKLEAYGIHTMGDVARLSLSAEDWLYKHFGVNAELLIDHAWGWEPVTMQEVKSYKPETRSMSSGQVLTEAYRFENARTVVREMADDVALDLVDHGLVTNQIILTVGYDVESLRDPEIRSRYHGKISVDRYGRHVPYHARGTVNFNRHTSSSAIIIEKVSELYDRIVNPALLIRRLTLSINNLVAEGFEVKTQQVFQPNLFTDYEEVACKRRREKEELAKERRRQHAILQVRKKFGKNAILKGLNFAEGAQQRNRNQQIGGHKA